MTEQNVPATAVQPVYDLSGAPMPNVRTLQARYNPFSQFFKLVGFMLNIMKLVIRSGH
jgi:hypothetical protein